MSGKVGGWVWDQDLPRHLKYVLLAYADRADHEGNDVYPSIRLVVKMTGLHRRSVQRATRELEKLGYLIPDGKGPKGVNKWRIPIAEGVARTSPPTERGDMGVVEGVARVSKGDGMGVTRTVLKPSLEPSLKDSRSNNRGRKNVIRKALEEEFVDVSRLKPPKLNTKKQKSRAGELWWAPLQEIADLTEWDKRRGRSLIRLTVLRMRDDNLTISSPKSILNVAKSIVAEGTGRSMSGAKEFLDDLG